MLLTITHLPTQQHQTHTATMATVIDLVGSTSTVEHDHEPYDTFQEKALALARLLLGDSGFVAVERMRGGSFNRVIGINVNNQPKYVLRIPRYPNVASVENEAAAFLFVLKNAGIAAPVVVTYDAGGDNAIGSPYAVMKLVEGDCLYPHWRDSSTLPEKLKIAKQAGQTFRQIIETRNKEAGWPAFRQDESGPNAQVHIKAFKWTAAAPFTTGNRKMVADAEWEPHTPPEFPVSRFMIGVFEAHVKELPDKVSAGPRLEEHIQTLGRLIKMVKEMDARGVFRDVGYSLFHNDIAPRNIMAYARGVEGEASLTFLDWDEVAFMPTFMACKPPKWIWEKDGRDERDAAEHSKERYMAFHNEVGDEFKLFAYNPVYDILREAMTFVIDRTVSTRGTQRKANKILAEWEQYVLANPV